MTAEQYWRGLCTRNPDLADGERVISIKAKNLRAIADQAWQQGSLHEHMLAEETKGFARDVFSVR